MPPEKRKMRETNGNEDEDSCSVANQAAKKTAESIRDFREWHQQQQEEQETSTFKQPGKTHGEYKRERRERQRQLAIKSIKNYCNGACFGTFVNLNVIMPLRKRNKSGNEDFGSVSHTPWQKSARLVREFRERQQQLHEEQGKSSSKKTPAERKRESRQRQLQEERVTSTFEQQATTSIERMRKFRKQRIDPAARNILYRNIPEHYRLDAKKTWIKRKRQEEVIGSVCSVSPKDSERFHLKLLLNFVTGVMCYNGL